ncbi:MAG: TonB-dependent receptor plug domain-containing protein [Bacteroidales bacterium]|nr:TonB-dependent receptor plug domain-containing protein [Bacteroidales bacterium]
MFRNILLSLSFASLVLVSCGSAANVASSADNSDDDTMTVGYGSVSKNAQAFSVSETVATDMERDMFKDIFDYLRSKVPGVQVGESADGGIPKILVRGQKDVWGNDPNPLFVLDEQIVPDPTIIRPEQIYSVQVLKDAAASAYGSKSNNGVIIFKTIFAHEKEVQEAEQRRAEKAAKKAARKN